MIHTCFAKMQLQLFPTFAVQFVSIEDLFTTFKERIPHLVIQKCGQMKRSTTEYTMHKPINIHCTIKGKKSI
jgi:hypothetical protein